MLPLNSIILEGVVIETSADLVRDGYFFMETQAKQDTTFNILIKVRSTTGTPAAGKGVRVVGKLDLFPSPSDTSVFYVICEHLEIKRNLNNILDSIEEQEEFEF